MVEEKIARGFLIQIPSIRDRCLEKGQNAAFTGDLHPFLTLERTETVRL